MADPLLYESELNPIVFYDADRAVSDKYQTKHFDTFPFDERAPEWMQAAEHHQIWQTTDIVNFQFQSEFDPIVIELLDADDNVVIALPTLVGLPNMYLPGTYSFEASMSLAGLATGCYRFKRTLGSGITQKIQYSACNYISATAIPNTLLIEYYSSKDYYKDVLFISGIKFQLRVPGWLDYDRMGRKNKQEVYKDQLYNQKILSSVSAKNIPVYFGDEFGLPTDILNILEQAHECDNVLYDNMLFAVADGQSMEYIDIEGYRKRGMHTIVEPGINRNSRISSIDVDTTKKLMVNINVDSSVFGDLSNSGSNNTIPVINILQE